MKWAAGLLMVCALEVSATQHAWFTVIGDEADANANTVQVNPVSLSVAPEGTVSAIRVNRSEPRTSWDGIPYRSYEARVRFDCDERTAQYLSIEYYASPLWTGDKTRPIDYTRGTPRRMRFLDMQPNPTDTIIRATCRITARARRAASNPSQRG